MLHTFNSTAIEMADFTIDNLFYVTNADIAENGTVIVSGSYNKESKSDTILICNKLGEKIFSQKVKPSALKMHYYS